MKNHLKITTIFGLLLISSSVFAAIQKVSIPEKPILLENTEEEVAPTIIEKGKDSVACTMDIKICSDGSAVGRVSPNCEFKKCPGETEEIVDQIKPLPQKKLPNCPTFKEEVCEENEVPIDVVAGDCLIKKCVRPIEVPIAEPGEISLNSKRKVLENCQSWFDGCNNCSRENIEGDVICTERFCNTDEMQPIKCLNYFNDKDLLIEKIKNAKSEEDRVKIIKAEKKEKQMVKTVETIKKNNPIIKKDKLKKVSLISEKSKEIFTKFDIILAKIKKIKKVIDNKIDLLKDKDIDFKEIKNKSDLIKTKIKEVDGKKAEAWILMQSVIDIDNKEEIKENLDQVRKQLVDLKINIKGISLDIRSLVQDLKSIFTN